MSRVPSAADIAAWAKESAARVRTDGRRGAFVSLLPVWVKALQQTSRFADGGTSIWEFDWDLLLVMDACRYDLAASFVEEYAFLDGLEPSWSVASWTPRWMRKTFTAESTPPNLRYLCGNPSSDGRLDASLFDELDEVWRYGWDDDSGILPARVITDRVIEAARETPVTEKPIVAHYMQPHYPFITRDGERIFWSEPDAWTRAQDRELSHRKVLDAYRQTMAYALDEVSLLLENVDAERVLITADHGNCVGEWGLYGHNAYIPIAALRKVPVAPTTATDHGTHQPATNYTNVETSAEEQLSALGYTE